MSYDGRMPTTLQVRAAHKTKGPRGQPPPAPLAGRVLWVGNLPFKVRPNPNPNPNPNPSPNPNLPFKVRAG